MKKTLLLIAALFSVALVHAQCTAVISFQLSAAGNQVTFYDSSQVSSSNYYTYWTFGDGTSGSGKTINKYYNVTGYVTVCMTIIDSARNCVDSTCISVYVNGGTSTGCSALFYYNVSSTNYRMHQFANRSSGSYSYLWYFGDGDTSTAMNPTHTYARDSTYQVILITYDSAGNACDSTSQWIQVPMRNTPVGCNTSMSLTLDTSNYRTGVFTATSNGAMRYHWDFGDGDTSNAQNTTHTYSADSVYYVTLISYDSSGMPCDTIYGSITVYPPSSGCTASFSYTGPTGTATGYRVDFTSNVNSMGTGLYWTFGDGTNSTSANPSHTYSSPGTYAVWLYVSYGGRICDSALKYIYIDSTCRASFYVAVDTNNAYSLYLINNSYNVSSNATYYWDFGDGSTSSSANPTHSYSTYGRYYVCLTITDSSAGCSSTFCDSVGMDSAGNVLKKDGFTIIVLNESDLTSVKELKTAEVKLYPNPSEGQTTLQITDESSHEFVIEIFDAQGVLIQELEYTTRLGENKLNIDLSEEAKGLYFIHLRSNSSSQTVRYIHN